MNTIKILVNEHDNIKKILKVVRKICIGIVEGKEIPHDDLVSIIDFIRNYADKYHHGKEEDMLFKDMAKELEDKIGPGPVQGMLIEHDFGRGFVRELEAALKAYVEGNNDVKVDIIANAMGYANLLERHIFKEDNMLYKYAEKNLSEETMSKLDREFKDYEENKEHIETKEKYIRLVEKLEKKYM
ncbi:hemerythrin domain-containing protein [Proteiniborus sp.]|uniref:hemerythrin domain-containing protein n=1 Tax=Proteiniborus sp. TaxID=2079015 RepID=UPI00332A5B1A